MSDYWDGRFKSEGRIWGGGPSRTAERAHPVFRAHGVKTVLVPGAGYGRNADYFAGLGYRVTGVEISEEALKLAALNTAVTYLHGSVLDMSFDSERFDGLYCFNVLHLFRSGERAAFIGKCGESLKDGGIAFFVVFSEAESQFGKGNEVEWNTFESKPGRPVHFFTAEDLAESFRGFEVLDAGLMDDPEDHGREGPHVHRVRFISVKKR